MSESADQDRIDLVHELLLRLAGRLPDDLVAMARLWLAAGQERDLAIALARAVVEADLTLTHDDADTLSALLDLHDADPGLLDEVVVSGAEQPPPYDFATEAPESLAMEGIDGVEEAAVAAVTAEPAARGLWRAWRVPAPSAPWPPPRRVFLVEVDVTADRAALAARVQDALAAAGETAPQVEVFHSYLALPAYQRFAWSSGELLWTRAGDPAIRIAAVFDEVDDEEGPRFTAARPRVTDEQERERLLAYLRAGEDLLLTTARMDDVVDRSARASVPLNFRSDGRWIWTDATVYYLEKYLLEPDPELVAHIRSVNHVRQRPDGVAVRRAMDVLRTPPEEKPVWTHTG